MGTDDIHFPPLRDLDDFVMAHSRFGPPDYQNKERWNNRIVNNLMYYQTNYCVLALLVFALVMYFRPVETILGAALVVGLTMFLLFATHNRGQVKSFKQEHPVAFLAGIMSCATVAMYTVGSVAVFIFSIALPILIILLHASFRMRNLKNKVQNKVEAVGFKTTPMGVAMRLLDQEL